jgi:hypothetical protein
MPSLLSTSPPSPSLRQVVLIVVRGVGKLHVNPGGSSVLSTSLSNVDVGDNEIIQDFANNAHVII